MPNEKLNIYQKLLKIADMAGVLQKNKSGFNYKYVTEEEIQAKITAGMQKYRVMLYPSIVPDTLTVEPYHYEKIKTKKVKDDKGKDTVVEYTVPVNEVIVKAEVTYVWVNCDNPEEKIECRWAYIGQMEDASQAFGAGATYGNRYYLMKALQLATTEADPDNYRSKQKEAETYDENKDLEKAVKQVVDMGSKLMQAPYNVDKDVIKQIVGKHNGNNQNPASIKSLDVCEAVMSEFEKLLAECENKKSSGETKATTTSTTKGAKK